MDEIEDVEHKLWKRSQMTVATEHSRVNMWYDRSSSIFHHLICVLFESFEEINLFFSLFIIIIILCCFFCGNFDDK